jgi:hypothetical protein
MSNEINGNFEINKNAINQNVKNTKENEKNSDVSSIFSEENENNVDNQNDRGKLTKNLSKFYNVDINQIEDDYLEAYNALNNNDKTPTSNIENEYIGETPTLPTSPSPDDEMTKPVYPDDEMTKPELPPKRAKNGDIRRN